MVTSELLEELNRIQGNFTWHYEGQSKRIRAKLRFPSHQVLFDPIGAVCYSRTGLAFDEDHWFGAAERLGLSHIDAADLTAAANNVSPNANQPYMHRLRCQIIDDVRLQPETADTVGLRIPDGFMGFVSTLFGRTANSSVTSNR